MTVWAVYPKTGISSSVWYPQLSISYGPILNSELTGWVPSSANEYFPPITFVICPVVTTKWGHDRVPVFVGFFGLYGFKLLKYEVWLIRYKRYHDELISLRYRSLISLVVLANLARTLLAHQPLFTCEFHQRVIGWEMDERLLLH